jgi:hypothetical protein
MSDRLNFARLAIVLVVLCASIKHALPPLHAEEERSTATIPAGRLLLCGMDEVFEIEVPVNDVSTTTKLWSWRAKDCAELPAGLRDQFKTTDECKLIGEDRCLITSSGGGCALVERASGKAVWYASVPNAHSIELLPNDRVIVASSVAKEGNRLVLFDLMRPEIPIWHTALTSAHGVVWDEASQRLWALGMDKLESYSLKEWTSSQPSLERQTSYSLPSDGGHDLQAVPNSNDLVLSTHEHVYLFDREAQQFRPHPQLHEMKDVKCISMQPEDGSTAWLQGNKKAWWTDTIHFLNPTASQLLADEKLYKARWIVLSDVDSKELLSCQQPSPEAMAAAVGVKLPPSPWHVANIWWNFEKPVEDFTSLEMDVTIDRDIPDTYNLYVSPCGVAKINGLQFYGGLQTNVNGWANKESRTRVHPGKGGIFSRWSSDQKTPIGLDHVQTAAPECLVESAGYEGEFASVRRPYAWTKGTYTFCIIKREAGKVKDVDGTWFECLIRDASGQETSVGRVFFEGSAFTFWERHSAFVEVYSTAKIPRSGIPKVNLTFGWPRLNGEKVKLKDAFAYYPSKQGPASPDCAVVKADGENCIVELGPIFVRDESTRRHPLGVRSAE